MLEHTRSLVEDSPEDEYCGDIPDEEMEVDLFDILSALDEQRRQNQQRTV